MHICGLACGYLLLLYSDCIRDVSTRICLCVSCRRACCTSLSVVGSVLICAALSDHSPLHSYRLFAVDNTQPQAQCLGLEGWDILLRNPRLGLAVAGWTTCAGGDIHQSHARLGSANGHSGVAVLQTTSRSCLRSGSVRHP